MEYYSPDLNRSPAGFTVVRWWLGWSGYCYFLLLHSEDHAFLLIALMVAIDFFLHIEKIKSASHWEWKGIQHILWQKAEIIQSDWELKYKIKSVLERKKNMKWLIRQGLTVKWLPLQRFKQNPIQIRKIAMTAMKKRTPFKAERWDQPGAHIRKLGRFVILFSQSFDSGIPAKLHIQVSDLTIRYCS